MPDPVYTGEIQDKGGAVHNLRAYGAVGNGTRDDTPEIRTAIAAVPDGGTLYIPRGIFRITETIVIDRPISLLGSGPGSAFWVDLSDTSKIGIVIGRLVITNSVNSPAENQSYRNFGIFGAPGSCTHGLGVFHIHRSSFENVHVRPGSTAQAVVVGGCHYGNFNFVISNNSDDGYPFKATTPNQGSRPGAWHGAGVLVADLRVFPDSGSVMPTNASVFNCIVQGGYGGGLACQPQAQQGGNNQITGTYEGFAPSDTDPELPGSTELGAGYPLRIEGCAGFEVHDVHVEASVMGSLIKGCTRFTVRESGFFTNTQTLRLEPLRIESSTDFVVDRVYSERLNILPDCVRYDVRSFVGRKDAYSHPRTQDAFVVTSGSGGASGNAIWTGGMGPFTGENLVANGDLSRWPLGFNQLGNAPGLTRGESYRRFNRYGVRVIGAAAASEENRATLAIPVPDALRYTGQPVTIWADIKRISGAEVSLGTYEAPAGSFLNSAHVASTELEWVRVSATYYPQAGKDWTIIIHPLTNGAYEYYLGGVGALVGVAAPMGSQTGSESFQNGIQVMGKRVEYAAAAPTSGIWQPGDIVFNTAPAPGGMVGWVCTAAGPPSTWKTFGAISS